MSTIRSNFKQSSVLQSKRDLEIKLSWSKIKLFREYQLYNTSIKFIALNYNMIDITKKIPNKIWEFLSGRIGVSKLGSSSSLIYNSFQRIPRNVSQSLLCTIIVQVPASLNLNDISGSPLLQPLQKKIYWMVASSLVLNEIFVARCILFTLILPDGQPTSLVE